VVTSVVPGRNSKSWKIMVVSSIAASAIGRPGMNAAAA
jgi:hypothetical protein